MHGQKKGFLVVLCVVVLLMAGCGTKPQLDEVAATPTVTIFSDDKQYIVDVEVADSTQERSVGLMFREELPTNRGMFFIFEEEQTLSFWMKNTLIPLDIIFIDEDFEIVTIVEAEPCAEDPCPSYTSTMHAQYVLEVNRGFSEERGIEVGDKVVFIS